MIARHEGAHGRQRRLRALMSPAPLLLAVDQGTTGTSALLVGLDGTVHRRAHREVPVSYPRPGWVEQDARELERTVRECCDELLRHAPQIPVAMGISNQRETLVLFDRRTHEPVAPAIVWQDRRTAARCKELRALRVEPMLRQRTGLLLDPYFTATKLQWLLDEEPELRARARRGELCAATVDTWLVARLTDGEVVATDASNASRTLLYDLHRGEFDSELCAIFDIPMRLLPEVRDSAGSFGTATLGAHRIEIRGVAGDQQAALFGQACLREGQAKNTYGTGSFVLVNSGPEARPAPHGLLTTVAWRVGGRTTFALEGSIFVTGAGLKWLRDGLGVITASAQAGPLFDSVPDSNGCWFVPALAGLGAPWWDPDARGAFLGLSAGVRRAHLVRAVVEAMAYRTRDVIEAMEAAGALRLAELRVDGGASVMDGLLQFQADLIATPVARAATAETTGVGAAWLAAVGAGLIDEAGVAAAWRPGRRFEPATQERPADAYRQWLRAVSLVRSGTSPGAGG